MRLDCSSAPTRRTSVLSLFALFAVPQVAFAATPQPVTPYRIVILGDSLTAGFGLPRSQAFPARLNARLRVQGYGATIINAGLSGDTSAGALARFDYAVPKGVNGLIIAIGANDMLQGQSPKAALANIEAIIQKAKARKLSIAILGMRAPSNWGAAYRKEFDAIYPALAKKYGLALDPFVLEGVALDPKLNQSDGIHPNATGADAIAARLTPFVVRAFKLRKQVPPAATRR
jgi:acyl-CoA thioesterase-1